jgi:hypothetical protein
MELMALGVIFIALLAIIGTLAPKSDPFPKANQTKPLSAAEERSLVKRVMTKNTRQSDLVIYWSDTLVTLTYAERKYLEQSGVIVSLTPHEVLIEDPATKRKVAVRRHGDPAAPRLP